MLSFSGYCLLEMDDRIWKHCLNSLNKLNLQHLRLKCCETLSSLRTKFWIKSACDDDFYDDTDKFSRAALYSLVGLRPPWAIKSGQVTTLATPLTHLRTQGIIIILLMTRAFIIILMVTKAFIIILMMTRALTTRSLAPTSKASIADDQRDLSKMTRILVCQNADTGTSADLLWRLVMTRDWMRAEL